jgi:Domain of unknown function (DUF4149)
VQVWKTLTVTAMAAWLGVMVFFSFSVAPLAFRVSRSFAADVVAMALPRYYWFGAICCVLALLGLSARGEGGRLPGLILCGLMLGLIGYTVVRVIPAVEAARAAGDHIAFVRAHRLSVGLNIATMVDAILVLVLEAVLPRRSRRPQREAAPRIPVSEPRS